MASQSYRFTQTLLQDVIYQNLLLQRRTEMHCEGRLRLWSICTEPDPERLDDLLLLGHHFA